MHDSYINASKPSQSETVDYYAGGRRRRIILTVRFIYILIVLNWAQDGSALHG